jgi:hypothetical protein
MRGSTLADDSTACLSTSGTGNHPTQLAETLRGHDGFFDITIFKDAPTNNCAASSESLSDDRTLLFITIEYYNGMASRTEVERCCFAQSRSAACDENCTR